MSALFIIESMQCIPGNRHFQGTVEYGTLINFFFGRKAHIAGQIVLYLGLQANSIAALIQVIQAADLATLKIFGKTCGYVLGPNVYGWTCVNALDDILPATSPFGSQFVLFSIGYLIIFAIVFPLSFVPIEDNIYTTIFAFILTALIFLEWTVSSFVKGLDTSRVPIADGSAIGEYIGIIMLNYGFIFTVPSWVNLKQQHVNIQETVWLSTMVAMVYYILIGLIRTFIARSLSSNLDSWLCL